MQFNEYLRQCREYNNLTQEQLVHELYSFDIDSFSGLETTTVSKWERQTTSPHLSRQIAIIQYFQYKSGMDFPCWKHHSFEEIEDLIGHTAMQNFIGNKKRFIQNFPSDYFHLEDLEVYHIREIENITSLKYTVIVLILMFSPNFWNLAF